MVRRQELDVTLRMYFRVLVELLSLPSGLNYQSDASLRITEVGPMSL